MEQNFLKGAISLNKNTLLKAAVFGLAVGDALGVPYEFRNRDTFTVTRMTSGGVHKQPKGTWSDDTGLTLATCYSIQKKGGIDLADMMRDFRAWLWHGAFTVDGRIFDVGNTCGQAINVGHGLGREDKQGNGSLMRILPLAFLPGISDEAIADVSALTHDSSVCKELCIIYVHIARELIQGADLKTAISRSVSPDSNYRHLLDIENFPRKGDREHGTCPGSDDGCTLVSEPYPQLQSLCAGGGQARRGYGYCRGYCRRVGRYHVWLPCNPQTVADAAAGQEYHPGLSLPCVRLTGPTGRMEPPPGGMLQLYPPGIERGGPERAAHAAGPTGQQKVPHPFSP